MSQNQSTSPKRKFDPRCHSCGEEGDNDCACVVCYHDCKDWRKCPDSQNVEEHPETRCMHRCNKNKCPIYSKKTGDLITIYEEEQSKKRRHIPLSERKDIFPKGLGHSGYLRYEKKPKIEEKEESEEENEHTETEEEYQDRKKREDQEGHDAQQRCIRLAKYNLNVDAFINETEIKKSPKIWQKDKDDDKIDDLTMDIFCELRRIQCNLRMKSNQTLANQWIEALESYKKDISTYGQCFPADPVPPEDEEEIEVADTDKKDKCLFRASCYHCEYESENPDDFLICKECEAYFCVKSEKNDECWQFYYSSEDECEQCADVEEFFKKEQEKAKEKEEKKERKRLIERTCSQV